MPAGMGYEDDALRAIADRAIAKGVSPEAFHQWVEATVPEDRRSRAVQFFDAATIGAKSNNHAAQPGAAPAPPPQAQQAQHNPRALLEALALGGRIQGGDRASILAQAGLNPSMSAGPIQPRAMDLLVQQAGGEAMGPATKAANLGVLSPGVSGRPAGMPHISLDQMAHLLGGA